MKSFHPESWSQQARALSDNLFKYWEPEKVDNFFKNSYRHPLILRRAAKRYGRLMRQKGNRKNGKN